MAFIYGNIMVADKPLAYERSSDGSNGWAPVFVEYGMGEANITDLSQQIRYGTVYFYNNRVYSKYDARSVYMIGSNGSPIGDSVPVFQLANRYKPSAVDARMNLFYGTSATAGATARPFALFGCQGTANVWSSNWSSAFQNAQCPSSDGAFNVGTPFDGTGVGGLTASTASPGFVSESTGNYLTTASSPYASLSAAYPTAVTKRGLAPIAGALPPVVPFGQ